VSAVVAEVAVVVGSQTTRARGSILTGGVGFLYTKVRIIGYYIVDALLFSRASFLSFCFFPRSLLTRFFSAALPC
jgi:hypothetical protein